MARPWRRGRSVEKRFQDLSQADRERYMYGFRMMYGRPDKVAALTPPPPKRDKVFRPYDHKPAVPLEREILSDVLKVLRLDPRVGYVWRQTSGTFMEGDRFIKAGPVGMPDVLGVLRGGKFFAIEVKRPGGEPKPHQQKRIDHFKAIGAISGYCWSVETALALLP